MNKLTISPSPHIFSGLKTQRLMLDVIIALIPALLVSTIFYGWNVLVITGFSILCCVGFEWLIGRFLIREKSTVGDLSAALTGMLLAFNLPVGLPLWMVAIGALVAIGVAKMSFGGLGRNPFNPALVGRVFLLFSFPVAMTTFPLPEGVDAMSGATPLAFLKAGVHSGARIQDLMPEIGYNNLLIGLKGGSLGEIAALALLVGFVYLLWRKVISWHIPVFVLGTMAIFAQVTKMIDPVHYIGPEFHLLTGGAILGAVFMATDYVTSPMTVKGMVIFAVGIGLLTMIIRLWGGYPEGMSFAILIMNAFVPLINKYVKPRRFGAVKAAA